MRLIGLAVVLAVSLTLVPLAAGAQQTEKDRRIGRYQSRTGHQPVGGPFSESPCKLKGLSHT
jgi:hypothetical protein